MLNRCEFIGHIGNKAEIKTLPSGAKVASFSIAITERAYTNKAGTQVAEKTTWVNISAWNGLADIIDRYTDKGSHLYIAGKYQVSSYEKDGITRYKSEIVAEQIELLSRRNIEEGAANSKEQTAEAKAPSSYSTPPRAENEEDLPF